MYQFLWDRVCVCVCVCIHLGRVRQGLAGSYLWLQISLRITFIPLGLSSFIFTPLYFIPCRSQIYVDFPFMHHLCVCVYMCVCVRDGLMLSVRLRGCRSWLRPLQTMFAIQPDAPQSNSEASQKKYAPGLFLTEAASSCAEQIERGRKSNAGMAQRFWSVFEITHPVQTPDHITTCNIQPKDAPIDQLVIWIRQLSARAIAKLVKFTRMCCIQQHTQSHHSHTRTC